MAQNGAKIGKKRCKNRWKFRLFLHLFFRLFLDSASEPRPKGFRFCMLLLLFPYVAFCLLKLFQPCRFATMSEAKTRAKNCHLTVSEVEAAIGRYFAVVRNRNCNVVFQVRNRLRSETLPPHLGSSSDPLACKGAPPNQIGTSSWPPHQDFPIWGFMGPSSTLCIQSAVTILPLTEEPKQLRPPPSSLVPRLCWARHWLRRLGPRSPCLSSSCLWQRTFFPRQEPWHYPQEKKNDFVYHKAERVASVSPFLVCSK